MEEWPVIRQMRSTAETKLYAAWFGLDPTRTAAFCIGLEWSTMPAGDPQRTWFPEMLDTLRARWCADLTFEQMIELCGELDTILLRIRSERHIRPPVVRCRRCGHVGEAAEPRVTVRAMILSLDRFGIAPAGQAKEIERGWAAYRKQYGLNLYGKVAEPAGASASACVHSNVPAWRSP